jgi:neutral ceramidase
LKRNKFFKGVLKFFLIFLGVLIVIALFIIAPIERTEDKGTAYYNRTFKQIDSIPSATNELGLLKVGWAKINITPKVPVSIASYGLRDDFEGVHDSIWCRAFVFDNGKSVSALVTVDLLIFPPAVIKRLKNELPKIGFSLENTLFSASHTHNGAGGWAEGLGGRFLAGEYNEKYVQQLTQSVLECIKQASLNKEEASIGFEKYQAIKYVSNRLSKDLDDLDHWLRVIKIKKKSGQTAAVVTYAAHSNVLSMNVNQISGDYAGALVDSLEKSDKINFAAYCAGAVASHTCKTYDKKNFNSIKMVASYLSNRVLDHIDSIKTSDTVKLRSLHVPVYLRDPQLKISENYKVRPAVFNYLLKEQDVYVSAMQVGDIIIVGTPCDFSGELVQEFNSVVNDKQIDLVITSFNGGYIGYIIPDKYYDIGRREAMEMNWYGPHSGEYFTDIIKSIISKI